MSEKLNKVDWEKYSRQGLDKPDFLRLIQDISSEDWLTRQKSWSELDKQLEYAYEKRKNQLPYDIVPVFIELLQSGNLPEKTIVTDLLISLMSYSEIETLQEPYKSEALRLKNCVCQGIETYRLFLEDADTDMREDINFLIVSCEK